MKLTKPYFYDDFVCIASKCTDNCCIGWEIDIDPVSLERFRGAGGEFGKRLCSAIHKGADGVHTFAFGEGERCALLREDGLCELILNMGEDSLCDICALHPRFFGWYNGLKEAGLGLCCEEVCRLIFSNSTPLRFISEEIDEECEQTCSDELLTLLLEARTQLFALLQNRNIPLCDRTFSAAVYTCELQTALDNGTKMPEICILSAEKADIFTCVDALLKAYGEMESINAHWDELLSRLSSRKKDIAEALPKFRKAQSTELWRYEHIAVYFCYRYFLDGVFEGEIISRLGLAVAATLSMQMIDCLTWLEKGTLSEWDRIENMKLYSKQVEYSEENVELMYNAVWEVPELSVTNIAACL